MRVQEDSEVAAQRDLPLSGMKVLDLSRVLAGPWCAMLLGDLGAEVVKVEEPTHGDDTRRWGTPLPGGTSTYYDCTNRNKRSIALDLGDALDRETAVALAARADVVIENFKLGGVEKFGLDYASVSAVNPGVVYCSISGFGRTGPSSDRLGYDIVVQGESGLMAVNGESDGGPLRVGIALADISTGMFAAQAVLAALVGRHRTGRGAQIDMSLFDCGFSMLAYHLVNAAYSGRDPDRLGNHHADIIPYGVFETADRPTTIAIGNERQYQLMCRDVLSAPELAEEPMFASNRLRSQNRAAFLARFEPALRRLSRNEILKRMDACGIPGGEVRTVVEACRSDAVAARRLMRSLPHVHLGAIGIPVAPFRFDGRAMPDPTPPPELGEHGTEIVADWLGEGSHRAPLPARKTVRRRVFARSAGQETGEG